MKLSTIAITLTSVLTTFAEYEDVCEENKHYCVVTCDDRKGVKSNICSEKDLNFECLCNDLSRPIGDYGNFPAKRASCNEKLLGCNDKCNDEVACLTECSNEYKCIFKDPHDGNVTKTTTTTQAKGTASSTPSGPPKLNGNNALTNVPTYTFVAATLFALSLYL